ncbi:MAG: large-conductance mechanosensitive channel protein MscL [Leptolyngbya sp. PLA2]|nr:large-conductance mechanosensitive channel protein MscL [Leptolyngbya sp.]MCE7972297.1 large-conductance mechanosensitive channel protein MscL [Leptolyngbya sp. PL-A2]MCQ3939511.1 large conductance mechanosensitive channel protein MscL [cyanobacterium CYA1]MCZ7632231.1 large-conductance mechanosensitive channel protein MscL [Phycisphaerales bacterium]MDL1903769.1 large-conductance mechanosensitive channel protein MscL [Synechococcales cyanobacterium CNB]GIK18494.1 MAG: large-conductance mec
MPLIREFREFALRGNVVDMAVGIVIGAAFTGVVKALVDKVMMPPIGLLMGGVDFAEKRLVLREAVVDAAGAVSTPAVTIGYGEFINALINLLIVALALFIVVKAMNEAKRRFEKEKQAAPPPAPPEDVTLLREIRDLLRQRS